MPKLLNKTACREWGRIKSTVYAASNDPEEEDYQDNDSTNGWQEGTGEIPWNREGKKIALSPVYRHPSLPGLFLYRGMCITDPPTDIRNCQIYHESSGRLLAWTQKDEKIERVQKAMLQKLVDIDWTQEWESLLSNDKIAKVIRLFNASWGVWTY